MSVSITPGDLVYIHFKFGNSRLRHYGIVAEDTRYIYHFDVKKSVMNFNPKDKFHATPRAIFLLGAIEQKAYVLNIKVSDINIVLERAKILENLNLKYNITDQNCQHTATWCKLGEWTSNQVDWQNARLLENFIVSNITRKKLLKLLKCFTFLRLNKVTPKWLTRQIKKHLKTYPEVYQENNTVYFTPQSSKTLKTKLNNFLKKIMIKYFTFHRCYTDEKLCIDELPIIVKNKYKKYKTGQIIEIILRIVIILVIIFCSLFHIFTSDVIQFDNQKSSEAPVPTIESTVSHSPSSEIKSNNFSNDSLYTVDGGDVLGLGKISEKCYKDYSKFTKIIEANPKKFPNGSTIVKKGWRLVIPGGCQGSNRSQRCACGVPYSSR